MKYMQMIAVTLALTATLVADAHEGHGIVEPGNSLRHYLTEPLHVIPLLLIAGIVIFLVRSLRKGRRNRKSQSD